MTPRTCLLAGVAAASLTALSDPAYAAPDPGGVTSPTRADTFTDDPTAAADDAGAIIVTARRRQETAQDVPLAISVVDAAAIEATGTFNIQRLQQLAPTLQVYSSNPRNTSVNIRGLGVAFGLTSDEFV
mgnify:FL=1